MELEMKIKGLMIDPITNMPIIILRDPASSAVLPIWVGIFEANAIALQIEKIATPRPMTHDLLKSMISGMQASVEKVVITDLKDNTFYALIFLNHEGRLFPIDSRPSDAIALALRTGSPIFVNTEVIEKAKNTDLTKDAGESERIRKWLENLDPDEMGKYEM
ncbi:MAG TPA: bifunctional nuclease family protein [Candidatus Polarisedimenticolia bacterium]|nr:bifunctional nuclease family protein [Candidatus Polarisedimenticolia bacterium]